MKIQLNYKLIIVLTAVLLAGFTLPAQDDKPSPFDYGRMWTFEDPPTEWFKEAYDFSADERWFDDVRKSSLRFASWCSASFVSPEGLIMTNHHCSRRDAIKVQQEGENFDVDGYYAQTMGDERKVDGLYVEQMVMARDITEEVLASLDTVEGENSDERKENAFAEVEKKYASTAGWEGLRLQIVSLYSGVKYSVYGYQRYDDIRLVCIPENSIGFYGGDPDNFTYPRYNLDFTFWRAYDENGRPINSSQNYLKFNPDGAKEGEPVFVVGNPGSTERYRTIAQLEYDRDYRYNHFLEFLTNRIDLLSEEYKKIKEDEEKKREAQELLGSITNLANGQKAIGGILNGLKNAELFGRKKSMETFIRSKVNNGKYWNQLSDHYDKLKPYAWAANNLGPSLSRGGTLTLLHELSKLETLIKNQGPEEEIQSKKESIQELASGLNTPKEKKLFVALIKELKKFVPTGNDIISKMLGEKEPIKFVNDLFDNSHLFHAKKLAKLFKKNKKILKSRDPLIEASRTLITAYQEADHAFKSSASTRNELEEKIVKEITHVLGDAIPPDATFTLRISDGVVKKYDYNGTIAPYKTTFFGLYDRHYSHEQKEPWDLPKKWKNPPLELLKSPVNMVSTNDIIGGNSGSPLINKDKEAVGLIFDGNIESLPGNFIFDEEYNRTVSVHAGGIYAALKYIYKADRLVKELSN